MLGNGFLAGHKFIAEQLRPAAEQNHGGALEHFIIGAAGQVDRFHAFHVGEGRLTVAVLRPACFFRRLCHRPCVIAVIGFIDDLPIPCHHAEQGIPGVNLGGKVAVRQRLPPEPCLPQPGKEVL